MIESLADGGAFNVSGLSPMDSAMSVETYEGFDWLCYQKDKNSFE